MNNSTKPSSHDGGYFDSRDCVDVELTGPGDTTVRPCPPALLALLQAEREKILRHAGEQTRPARDQHGPASEGTK